MREEQNFTRLTLENGYGHKIVSELPYNDTTGDDIMQMVYTAMVGVTFTAETALRAMLAFAVERLDNIEVYEKDQDET